jgi:AcrR family transcriptional regulator
MTSRAEQKARTRKALVGSVLRIVGDGANFASVSLREVAKTAGVVPTSFYRHFGDMDELGLAVVDQLGLDLRRLMRGTLDENAPPKRTIDAFVEAYETYILDHADLVSFVNQARTGGSASLREAIAHELDFFATRIATGLRELLPGLRPTDRDTVADVVIAILVENATTLLELQDGSEAKRDEAKDELVRRLLVVLLGAQQLAATPAPRAVAKKTTRAPATKRASTTNSKGTRTKKTASRGGRS